MKTRRLLLLFLGASISFSCFAQDNKAAIESITASELRNHIFFLASDYLKGRVAATTEYEIAAQYVASQFAAAGLEPAVVDEEGNKSFFQGVPFERTVFNEEIQFFNNQFYRFFNIRWINTCADIPGTGAMSSAETGVSVIAQDIVITQ